MSRQRFSLSYKAQKAVLIAAFLILPIVLLATLSLYPALKLIFYSFTSWNGLSPRYPWVGLANYKAIFSNPLLFSSFGHNFAYLVGGLIQNVVALYFALILNSKIRGRNLFRAVLFMPFVMNAVAVVFIFRFLYGYQGALDALLQGLGLKALEHDWLGNLSLVNWSLAFVSLWEYFGFNMVIYLAALQSVPHELFEAAELDGAGRLQTLWHITLPNIRSIVQINLLLTISGAIEAFNIPFIMTNGSPPTATFLTNTVNVAFVFNNFGLASAMAIVLLIIVFVVLILQRWLVGIGRDAV